jgi:hypothetical protein
MISQVVVTRSTAPQQVELAEDVKRNRLEVRRDANRLLKAASLPPQRPHNVSPEGLYLPAFPTQESKWLTRTTHARMMNSEGFTILGVAAGGAAVPVGVVIGFADGITASLMPAIITGVLSGALLLGRKLVTNSRLGMKERMVGTAYEPFAEWVKNRYGVTVSRSSLSARAEHVITSGYQEKGYEAHSYLTDEVTGIKYAVCLRPDDEIYLAPYGSPGVEVPFTTNGAAISPLMAKSLNPPVNLPKEAENLHAQLMASVALLKTQELSVEMAHQVERTESVVGVVLTKYASIAKLKATEKARQDLVAFLQNQVEFVDGLIDQHADELTKQMGVEIAAVTEAGQHDSLLLEIKR